MNWIADDLDNDNLFYTDSNALEMQERIINYRPTWTFSTDEYASGNYYPVNSAISFFDKTNSNLQMTVMNDRAQGGSVLNKGRIELM